jgi:transcriptional regulator with GAF, ATPase, and Fis domain
MEINQKKVLQRILKTLNDSQLPKSSLSGVLDILAKKFLVKRSILLTYQTENDKLVPIAVNGLDFADFRRLENKAGKSIFRQVFDSRRTIFVEKLSDEISLNFLHLQDSETSLIAMPIVLENKTVGVFAAEFLHGENFDHE